MDFRRFELIVKLETLFYEKLQGLPRQEAASKYAYLPR